MSTVFSQIMKPISNKLVCNTCGHESEEAVEAAKERIRVREARDALQMARKEMADYLSTMLIVGWVVFACVYMLPKKI